MNVSNFDERVIFHDDTQTMEVDFSDCVFEKGADVHAFYDVIESRLKATGKSWYFLVNYRNTRINEGAWFAFSYRGKGVNEAYSLGSVRFDAEEETAKTIRQKAREEDFKSNLFHSRSAAQQRISEMRAEASEMRYAS
ncbi:MAG: hypothetical protein AAGE61_12335 [Pseudomonadota bacterium]